MNISAAKSKYVSWIETRIVSLFGINSSHSPMKADTFKREGNFWNVSEEGTEIAN